MLNIIVCVSLGLGLSITVSSALTAEPDPQILINLSNTAGERKTQFHNITDYETTISILNISSTVGFFILQVHSFIDPVILSYESFSKNIPDTQEYTTGTNVGLVWKRDLKNKLVSSGTDVAEFYLIRKRVTADSKSILLVLQTYSSEDPIPGGCNLSFETEYAPYQKINQSDEIIYVMSQPPSSFGVFCNQTGISTKMYYMYLKEYDNTSVEYFSGLLKMITADNISEYGTEVPVGLANTKYKQMYNRYQGTGRVFTVVVSWNGRSSVYVPAVSYGCDLQSWEEDCFGPDGVHWKVITAMLLIFGLFICFCGHRFFKTGMFIVGYTFGVMAMLVLSNIDDTFSANGNSLYSLCLGVLVAVTWIFLWWRFGIPVLAVQLSFLLTGIIVASICFYTQLGDIFIFSDNVAFWACFGSVLLISQIPLIYLRPLFYIITLSLVGSYAAIVAMSYYVGGNLQYIIINTYRRIVVKDFGRAVIDPPYQLFDITQTILWILVFGVGVYVQHKHSLGRPPFPPHRHGGPSRSLTERTPLTAPNRPDTGYGVI